MRLIVLQCHEDIMHNGIGETLTQLRSRYWVMKGRQVVKKILTKCTVCRKQEGKGYGIPRSPALPEFRISNDFAFTKIGVDYVGPLYVKDIYTQCKDMHKAYIALYTCASSGAIHLDLVPDQVALHCGEIPMVGRVLRTDGQERQDMLKEGVGQRPPHL